VSGQQQLHLHLLGATGARGKQNEHIGILFSYLLHHGGAVQFKLSVPPPAALYAALHACVIAASWLLHICSRASRIPCRSG
jgi:hypothetical protein